MTNLEEDNQQATPHQTCQLTNNKIDQQSEIRYKKCYIFPETYAAVLDGPVAPFLPSGSLKPTAMDSDLSESAVSTETVNRRMSSDMSGPLSDMPDGTTNHAQVANTCLPAGQRPNKTPIFISGVRDTRAFLAWLRAACPGGLAAQLKAEKLMVVPSTADGFRAVVSALRSLDGGRV